MSREAKREDDPRRLLKRLERWTAGVVLPTREGPHLCWVAGVADARHLHDACRDHGAPPRDVLGRALRMTRPPVPLDDSLLRAAMRDLVRLEAALAHAGRRAPHGGRIPAQRVDAAAETLRRQERAFHQLRAVPAPAQTPAQALENTLRFVTALRGRDAAMRFGRVLETHRRALVERAEDRRQLLERIVVALANGGALVPRDRDTSDRTEALTKQIATMRALSRLPGRARVRRLAAQLARALDLPASATAAFTRPLCIEAAHSELHAAARLAGEAMIAAAPRDETAPPAPTLDALACAAACLALVVPKGTDPPPPEDLVLVAGRLDAVLPVAGAPRPTLAEVVSLVRLAVQRHPTLPSTVVNEVARFAALVREGVTAETLATMQEADDLGTALEIEGTGPAAYCNWQPRLAASYTAAGLRLDLPREIFHPEHRPRSRVHAVLAACFVRHHLEPPALRADDASGGLDAAVHAAATALAPFGAAAAAVHSELERLRDPGAGLARRHEPELLAWLGDEALLDRYLALQVLAGEEPRVSSAVRADHDRVARRERERAHLESLPALERLQQARLDHLRSGEGTPTDRQPTRRDLSARIRDGWQPAWSACAERALLRVLRTAWGIRLPSLDVGWRAVLRYQLVCEDNRALLDWLLCTAAASPRSDLSRRLPRAAAWAERARRRFDVDAFHAPLRREVTVEGTRYLLATEENPVEVLRMGMPFETCLGLEEGCNAGSTVTNALEPNKRVLYVRDAAGAIVGRKLIGVSGRFELVGYNFYCSLDAARKSVLEAEVEAMCRQIAAAARLPVADSGTPEKVLGAFWYDDGPVAFTPPPSGVTAAYCAQLGRAMPELARDLVHEAHGWDALGRGDAEGALSALAATSRGLAQTELGAGIVHLLGERAALAHAQHDHTLALCLLRQAARRGVAPGLGLAGAAGHLCEDDADLETALEPLRAAELTPQAARDWVRAGRRDLCSRQERRGLARLSLEGAVRHARTLGVAALLQLCDAVAPLWACSPLSHDRVQVVGALQRLGVAAYARRRAPDAVLSCLRGPRRSLVAQRVALAIAARFTLHEDDAVAAPWALTFMEEAPRALPAVLRAVRTAVGRRPALSRLPDAMAALLRHGADPRQAAMLFQEESPFETLGPLLLWVPEVMDGLARFGNAAQAEKWAPGPWELHYHRVRATRWKAGLAERADRRDTEGAAAARWLGCLGEVRVLESMLQSKWRYDFATGNPPQGRRSVIEASLADARSVAAQLAQGGALDDRVRGAAIDPVTQRLALRHLCSALADGGACGPVHASAPGDGAAARGLALLLRGQTTSAWQLGMMEWMMARSVPATMTGPTAAAGGTGSDGDEDTDCRLTTATFGEALAHLVARGLHDLVLLPGASWASLWRAEPLKRAVITALAAPDHSVFEHELDRIERGAGGAAQVPGLFERCLVDRVRDGRTSVISELSRSALLRAFVGLRETGDASHWLAAFRQIDSYGAASQVLADLEAAWRAPLGSATAPTAPALEEGLTDENAWRGEKQETFRAWLLAAVRAEIARVMPASPPPSRSPAQLALQGLA